MLKATFVNGKWRPAEIRGHSKRKLIQYFKRAGLPWIYDKPTPKIDYNSPYNRSPKGSIKERLYEIRLADIRANMAEMDDRTLKYRIDMKNKQPMTGFVLRMHEAHAGLQKMEKQGKLTSLLNEGAEAQEGEQFVRKSPTVKGKYGKNKGGLFSKKDREVRKLTAETIADYKE